MALDELVQEIVVPDIHNNWTIYDRINSLIDGETKRVFLVGDLRPDERIDYEFIKKNSPKDSAQYYANFEPVQKQLHRLIQGKYDGDIEVFLAAQRDGKLKPEEKELIKKYAECMKALENIEVGVFAKESAVDYDRHEKRIRDILQKHPNVRFYGTPGNHDTIFIKDQVKSVDWLVYSQSLQNEGIFGAFGCRENFGEINPQFNGPEMKYVPFLDDDYEEISNSELYRNLHGVPINLIVTHSGGAWGDSHTEIQEGKRVKYPSGKGITKLGEENSFVSYEGHLHKAKVYQDPKSKVTVIRPGIKNIAKVWRRGKTIENVDLYGVSDGVKKQPA